jgi:hypothetical protein
MKQRYYPDLKPSTPNLVSASLRTGKRHVSEVALLALNRIR